MSKPKKKLGPDPFFLIDGKKTDAPFFEEFMDSEAGRDASNVAAFRLALEKGGSVDSAAELISSAQLRAPLRASGKIPAAFSQVGGPMHEAILFARIGWMKKYKGPQPGDERPVGGGEYNRNKKNLGHEAFNFLPIKGCVYGYIQPTGRTQTINLERIAGGVCGDSLNDALVVFVAKHPKEGGQRVVGWYKHATVFRKPQNSPHPERRKFEYFAVTQEKNAILLRTPQRKCEIPHGKGGMGQANVCYLYDRDSSPKQFPWIEETLKFIENY